MAFLAAAAPVIMAGAAVVGAGAAIYGAVQADKSAKQTAKQQEAMGRERFAASQRDALEARLQGRLAQSRQQAIAAASGGGAGLDAPSIVKLMTETGERSEYAAQVALYSGHSQKDYYYDAAAATRAGGRASLLGGVLRAAGTLAGGLAQAGEMAA
jgi:hypothetical protein